MSDERVVEGEVVGGVPNPPEPAGKKTFFHPLSGALILVIDWLAFGTDLVTGPAAVAVVAVLAFTATFYGVLIIQRRLHDDKPGPAGLKALIGAVAAGVPLPITGTIVGAAIIALSGLPTWPWRLPKGK